MCCGVPAQLFSLAGLGVVLHADVVGVEFMSGDVGEQLREVQPPQELHRVRVRAVPRAAGGEPVVEREVEGQRQGDRRPGVAARGAHRAAASPAESSPDQQVFPVRVRVDGRFEELPQPTGPSRSGSSGGGGERETSWGRLPRGAAWRLLRRPQRKGSSCRSPLGGVLAVQ